MADAATLKQQNDQLWRLVERQRHVIFSLREDLERLLAEREAWAAAAAAANAAGSSSLARSAPSSNIGVNDPPANVPAPSQVSNHSNSSTPPGTPRLTAAATPASATPGATTAAAAAAAAAVALASPAPTSNSMPRSAPNSPTPSPMQAPVAPAPMSVSSQAQQLPPPATTASATAAPTPVAIPPRRPQTSPPTQSQLARLRSSLHLLSLPVVGSFVRPNAKGKDTLHFVIAVRLAEPGSTPGSASAGGAANHQELWWIAKTYADLSGLESKARSAHKQYPQMATVHKLPEKSFFSPSSSSSSSGNSGASATSAKEMQRADARRYAVEAFLVQLLAVVCESPFGPLTQQLVDLVASDLHDPTTTVFSPDAAPVSGNGAGALGVDGIATPSSALSASAAADDKGFGQGLFGQDGGLGRLFKKSSSNPIGRSPAGAAPAGGAAARPNGLSAVNPAGGNKGRNRVFGTPLETAIAVSRIKEGVELPAVVYRCIEYLDAQNASNEEGIYRLSGSSATIRALKDRFNNDGDYDLIHSGEYIDVHAVAGLLKLFFRELPGSILTEQYHPYFMALQEVTNVDKRISELRLLVNMLPLANYTVLRALIAHLVKVVSNADRNKMTVRNIGIVFAPTLGIPAGVFSLMLLEFGAVFDVETAAGTIRGMPPAPRAGQLGSNASAHLGESSVSMNSTASSESMVDMATVPATTAPNGVVDTKERRKQRRSTRMFETSDGSSAVVVVDAASMPAMPAAGFPDQQQVHAYQAQVPSAAPAAEAHDARRESSDEIVDLVGEYGAADTSQESISPRASVTIASHASSSLPVADDGIGNSEVADTVGELHRTPSNASSAHTPARRSMLRNSLLYSNSAPEALLNLERSLTPVTSDANESAAMAMAVEADPLMATASADAEYERVARAQHRMSQAYLNYYAGDSETAATLQYMQFIEDSPGVARIPTPKSQLSKFGVPLTGMVGYGGDGTQQQPTQQPQTVNAPMRSVIGSLGRARSDSSSSTSATVHLRQELMGGHHQGSAPSTPTSEVVPPTRGASSRAAKRESVYLPHHYGASPMSGTSPSSAHMGSSPLTQAMYLQQQQQQPPAPTTSAVGSMSPSQVPPLSPRTMQAAEANLQALLRTDKETLSRELANMDPSQLAQLQALLVERSGGAAPGSLGRSA